MTEPQWSHAALNCADQARTEDFYTRWFGFTRARVVMLPDAEIIFLRNGPVLLELFGVTGAAAEAIQDGPHDRGAVRHIAFQTDDIDAFLQRMGDAAQVSLGPIGFDDFINGWRTVWLRDPDGVVVEVSQGYRDQDSVPDENRDTSHQDSTDNVREPA